MPLVSVLIPARNNAKFLPRAVRSALESLPSDAEVVVFDDASTENLPARMRWIRDRRVRLAAGGRSLVKSEKPLALYRHHAGQLTNTEKWKDQRWNDQVIVREAYSRLSESTLGVTPSASHPIWGSWGAETEADQDFVDALRAAIEARPAPERAYLTTQLGYHVK